MKSIRSSEKALERIRASGSFPTPEPQVGRGADDLPGFKVRRERSRTAEITIGDSDDEDGYNDPGRVASGSQVVAEERLRELNAAGLAALEKNDKARAKEVLEDALTAVKRGDIADAGLAAGTYGNYGVMLLVTGRDSDRAVDVLADAIVRITRVPPDLPSKDLERALKNMQAFLSSALERDAGDIRLEVISQYAAGAQLERDRKGFECLEHFRIANDLSRTCMGTSHPAHKAISTAFDRAKKAYAAGATTFQSKKDKANSKRGGKVASDVTESGAGKGDFFNGGDGLGLFEKGLSSDVWSALKDAGKGKPKGMRVNAGTAAKASLADRNQLQSRGASRSGKREPSPDIFTSGAGKKSNFLANLLGNDGAVDATPSSKMPSISLRPGSVSDKNSERISAQSSKKQTNKKNNKSSKRAVSTVHQPDFAGNEGLSTPRQNETSVSSSQPANPATVGRGGLKEISVPVPVPRGDTREVTMGMGSQFATPSNIKLSPTPRDSTSENKSASAASAASTTGDRGRNGRSPLTQQIDSEDEPAVADCCSPEESDRCHPVISSGHDSIDDMIGELRMDKSSADSTDRSPVAQQIHDEESDGAEPKFLTELKESHVGTADEERRRHTVAADEAAALAREKLAAGDLSAAREAMVVAGREWVAAGMDKTSELAAMAGKLAVGLARERLAAGDVSGATEAVSTAAVEFKKAGENRHNELMVIEVDIGEAAVKLGRVKEAVHVFERAVEKADEIGDVSAQSEAFAKLGNAHQLLGCHEDALKILNKRLVLAQEQDDPAGQAASYQALGQLCTVLGRSEEAMSMFERSNNLAAQNFDVAGQSKSQNGLGSALSALGRHDQALQKFSEALVLAQRAGDVMSIGIAQQGVGKSFTELGRFEEAVDALKKALETAERSGNVSGQSEALTALGQALTCVGQREEADDGEKTRSTMQRYEEALQMHSKALELAEGRSDLAVQNAACSGLANAYGALGRHDEAAEMFARLLEAMQKSTDAAGEATALNGLGDAYVALGKLDEAAAVHMRCLKIADELSDAKLQAASHMGLANAYKALGRYSEAVRMVEAAEDVAKKAGVELNVLHRKQWADAVTATLTLQCAYRMHLARRAMLAAMQVVYSRNIIVVQAAVRRNLVRNRYAQQLKRKRALLKIECTVVIQSKFRRALANRWWIEVVNGVLSCCARTRAALACSHRSKSNAAIVLQANTRARSQRAHGSEMMESERRSRGSCFIQAHCRRCWPRIQHRKVVAALILQAAARRRPPAALLAARWSLSNVSKFVRAALCRRKHAQHVASTLVCAYMRALAMRKRWESMDGAALGKTPSEMHALDMKRLEERCRAIERIQAAARRLLHGSRGREIMLQLKQTNSSSYLATICRRRSARDRHARLLASTYVQAWIRAILARKQRHESMCSALLRAACRRSIALEEYRKGLAAMIAQAALRRKVAGNRKQIEKASGSRLSRSARAALARRKYARLRLAAVLLGAVLRRGLGSRHGKAQMEESLQLSASSLLQAACRRAIHRRAFVRNAAARKLQAALRRCAAHQSRQRTDDAFIALRCIVRTAILRQNYVAKHAAAKRLQAVLRRKKGHVEGSVQLNEAQQDLHAGMLQAVYRRAVANSSYRKDLSARSLQAFLRRYCTRRAKMLQERTACALGYYVKAGRASRRYVVKRTASKVLQAVLRRCSDQERGKLQMDAVRQEAGAEALGAFCRRALAREAYQRKLASHGIQAAVQCTLNRETHRRRLAIITLQAALRHQHQAQSTAESEFACSSLRRYIRGALAVRQHACKRSAAVVLQACLRRCAGRSAGESRMQETLQGFGSESLQAVCRRERARNAYRQSLAAHTLQAAARCAHARHSHFRSTAAQTLEASVRCNHCRTAYARNLAAGSLQAVARRALAQHQLSAAQHSCDSVQRFLKAAIAHAHFGEQRNAAVRLEAAVRAHRDQLLGHDICEASAAESLQATCRRALARRRHTACLAACTLEASVRRTLHELAEQERKKQEEEEEERKREAMDEKLRELEEEMQRQEEERLQREAEEKKRLEDEEKARKEEEERLKREEAERLKEEEERLKREEEEKLKREEDERLKDQEEMHKAREEDQSQEGEICNADANTKQAESCGTSRGAPQQQGGEGEGGGEIDRVGQGKEGQAGGRDREGEEREASGEEGAQQRQGGDCEKKDEEGGENGKDQEGATETGEDAKRASKEEKRKKRQQEKEEARAQGTHEQQAGDNGNGEQQEDGEQQASQEPESDQGESGEGEGAPPEREQEHKRNREKPKGSKAKGADWERDMTPLAIAFRHTRYGNYRDVEKKLEEGIAVDSRGGMKDNTLLCEAAGHGHHRIAKLLLRNKADINAQNNQGNTPLHLAMEFNYKKVADYLAEKGARTDIRNRKGRTAYEMEVEDPDADDKEASPNAIRGGGRS